VVISFLLMFSAVGVWAQTPEPMEMKPEMTEIWEPEVEKITAGETPMDAPSDAIILFDGTDLGREWTSQDGGEPQWIVEDGAVTVKRGTGVIKTKRVFEDFQLHIEWRSPSEVSGEGQGRGNSGVFLQERYEVQVLDNYDNRTYRNGQAASVYKQNAPLVNACKAPGEWQTYDIIYTAPRFKDDGTYFTPPKVTVLHNGVLVQNNYELRGPTEYIGIPEYNVQEHGPGSIMLQDHGNPVSFRNIWIREL
ncbi:MAG: 3-keto-disaccharide hydrolase, partial [Tangfeifania sp.]